MFFLLLCMFGFQNDDAVFAEMVRVRRHLHQHPELSNRETETHKFLQKSLEEAGFERIETFAGTGLRVVYETGKPGPIIAFRADIDALPVEEQGDLPFKSTNKGVMHACGHDIHTGILFGTALAIKNDPSLTGTFVFLFQPAEEGPPPGEPGGASLMISEGALKDPVPDVIFGLHGLGSMPLGTIGWRSGPIMARADRFHIVIKGKQAHGSAPHQGIDPILAASQVINQAQAIVSRRIDPSDPVALSFGTFEAGTRFNIIPADAKLSGTIRSLKVETGDWIPQLLDQTIEGVARASGAGYKFENETMCPPTVNNDTWTKRMVGILKNDFELKEVAPLLAAEDFAYYGEVIPAVYFFLGTCRDGGCSNIHMPDYFPDEESLAYGKKAFYSLAKALSEKKQ